MKTSFLRQTVRAEDDIFLFTVPALMLAAVLAIGALTLMMGTSSDETVPTDTTPDSEYTIAFVGA